MNNNGTDLANGTVIVSSEWRKRFPTLAQLESGQARMLIEQVLPEGTAFLGSLSGVGKTWVALSMVKALLTGKPFLGLFKVPEKVPVAYLVPEMSGRAIRSRAEKLGIRDDDELRFWTLQQGILRLDDLSLQAMVKELHPVIFLDTAIRFLTMGADENSSASNNVGLANGVFALLRLGARAVVCLHHSPKKSGDASFMTLENVLRGTGDLGAMSEVVWGIERARKKKGQKWDVEYSKNSRDLTRLRMECVKGRDLENVAGDLVIQGRPYIDNGGDFRVLSVDEIEVTPESSADGRLESMVGAIQESNNVSLRNLSKKTGWNTNTVKDEALKAGYKWTNNGWVQCEPPNGAAIVDLSGLNSQV